MRPEIFSDPVLAWLGPVPVTRVMVTSAATSAVLIALALVLARAVVRRPAGRTAAAGRPSPMLEVFGGTLFLFISGAAVIGQLPGVPAPTSNLPATAALAVLVFVAVPFAGVRAQGPLGYLAGYFKPNPLLFPLHLISELSRTLALALRLFGNMLSGHLVVAMIVALVGLFLPVPLMALDLLIGLLQAYIFTVLACVYVGAAIRVGEGA